MKFPDSSYDKVSDCNDTNVVVGFELTKISWVVNKCPQGYPRLATFLSSDQNFMQYRGFGYLHSRVLLAQQCDIEQLERELDTIDLWDEEEGVAKKLRSKQRDDLQRSKGDMGDNFPFLRTRPEIIEELKRQLIDYDTMLLKAREIAEVQAPSSRDWRVLTDWFARNAPLVGQERDYILKREDLVTLSSSREGAGLDDSIERVLYRTDRFLSGWLRCHIIRDLFVTPELREKAAETDWNYFAPERLNLLANVTVAVVIFVLLVLPVVAMYKLSSANEQSSPFEAIGILIVFTLLFGTAMSSMTRASRQELFAASAAYCAVLVVFVSNFSTQTVEVVKGAI